MFDIQVPEGLIIGYSNKQSNNGVIHSFGDVHAGGVDDGHVGVQYVH